MTNDLEISWREAGATLQSTMDAPLALHDRLKFVAETLERAPKLDAGPQLLWRLTEGTVRALPLEEGIVVGREIGADLVLADAKVSKRHFRVLPEGTEYVLSDDVSRNGTYVNGRRVRRHVLRDGDIIEAGSQILVFWRGRD